MDSAVFTTMGVKYLSLPYQREFVLTRETVADLIEACLGAGVSCALVDERQFSPDFFRLSTREAGEVLQKLRTYDIRLAAVVTYEKQYPKRFQEMLAEENRGRWFGIFTDKVRAEEWFCTLA